jgi:hypothetical protein
LVPAVQKVREAAARISCANNLKQIGLASFQYADAQGGRLPPGYLGPRMPGPVPPYDDQFVGGHAYLLPYLDQGSIYQRLKVNWGTTETGPNWWTNADNWTMAQSRLNVFVCPSDNPYSSTAATLVVAHSYSVPPSSFTVRAHGFSNPDGAGLGRLNYPFVAGDAGHLGDPVADRFEGACTNRSAVRLIHITNGTGASNLLLIGESLGGKSQGVRDTSFAWMGVGALPTVGGLPESADWYHFSSRHPAIVQFCFADGSVRSIRTGISRSQLALLSGWHHGLPVNDALSWIN